MPPVYLFFRDGVKAADGADLTQGTIDLAGSAAVYARNNQGELILIAGNRASGQKGSVSIFFSGRVSPCGPCCPDSKSNTLFSPSNFRKQFDTDLFGFAVVPRSANCTRPAIELSSYHRPPWPRTGRRPLRSAIDRLGQKGVVGCRHAGRRCTVTLALPMNESIHCIKRVDGWAGIGK